MKVLLAGAITVEGTAPTSKKDMEQWHAIDLAEPHAVDVGQVTIGLIQEEERNGQRVQPLSIILRCAPFGVSCSTIADASVQSNTGLQQWQRQTRGRMENARAHALAPGRKAMLIVRFLRVALVALFIWLAATWSSIPGLALAAIFSVAVFIAAGPGLWQPRLAQWFTTRRPREWLALKSDAELYSERANNRRDNRIRLLTFIPTALIGAATVIVTWITRGSH